MKRIKQLIQQDPISAGIYTGERAFTGPLQAHVDLTNKCNLRCICCWNRSPLIAPEDRIPGWEGWELDYKRVLTLVDELAELGVRRVIYSGGGDPLFYPRLFDVLKYTSSKGIAVMLVSNLTAARRDTIEKVFSSGVKQLLVSLWAASPEAYCATHPGCSPEDFARVCEMMRYFVSLRKGHESPELIIMNVLSGLNYREFEKMIALAVGIGAARVWFQLVDVLSGPLKRLLLTREGLDFLLEQTALVAKKYASKVKGWQRDILDFDLFRQRLSNSAAHKGYYQTDFIDDVPCYMGWVDTRILANGTVCPCCTGDFFHLGNINENSFKEVWHSAEYREFRRKALTVSKKDRYFDKIKCYKVCDDWGLNLAVNNRYLKFIEMLQRMGVVDRVLWNVAVKRKMSTAIVK
jgi:MoaA/NifB/PqqE/SkfB family radical SAM enzyme